MDDIWNEGLLRAHVDFLKIDVDLKWDSIGRGFRDIVNSSAWLAIFARLPTTARPEGHREQIEFRGSKTLEKFRA